ncbi:MAG: Hydrolase, HAD subfamily IIIA [Candidatus Bipolaricaulis sibiricus]|uniref:Hydrolase, HAD subfamily IIIA n=1 Tax=Bipolaricaulis sibiricus TaxID=2501609 RepID=A0A410FTG5_BIPS1|nr:MAG: Hydrolase, HAD subfamily IIIA [Candidatus Bipolaricaulis sibiricus]
MKWVEPHHVARSVHDVDYATLAKQGIRSILFDLENTLCRWRVWELDERAWGLLRHLQDLGLRVAILTNAPLSPQHPLAAELATRGITVVSSARKPLRYGFKKALQQLHVAPHEAAIVGDQMLTDVLGGRRVGLVTVLVSPLDRNESWPTRINRQIERLLGRPR